jgi:DNA-binding CsgD family transcriptional regulator
VIRNQKQNIEFAMKIENWDQPAVQEGVRTPPSFHPHDSSFIPKVRHPHRKRHLAWEQAELASGGFYAHNLDEIAHRYPTLTPMELRVSALVKAMLPSWKIAEMLCIKEESVERYRCRIRRKLGIHGGWLQEYLAAI